MDQKLLQDNRVHQEGTVNRLHHQPTTHKDAIANHQGAKNKDS
jgi:hypothetical protein